ncbi:hypothetical protein KUTeg_008390 [Tegillarca granosa]|uniref:Uncharacterized protein n=1 Tax=Tegillarca granosa TaxID=220873 RepID=A0ABQ9F920_TEGGR|nr:hypothetical protein KUTeg_008390 [Tegillarca granosa]
MLPITIYKYYKQVRLTFTHVIPMRKRLNRIGWKQAQIGPSLLDLQHITQTRLDEISTTLTLDGIGYLIGSLFSGFLFRKFNSAILFIITAVVSALLTIAVPLCSIFELMLALFALKGIFDAFVESLSNAELFRIWKTDENVFVSTLHFCYTIGAALSPLVTAPFLLPSSKDELTSPKKITCNKSTIVEDASNYNRSSEKCLSMKQESNRTVIHSFDNESKLYIPYSITTTMYLLVAVLFFYSFIKTR